MKRERYGFGGRNFKIDAVFKWIAGFFMQCHFGTVVPYPGSDCAWGIGKRRQSATGYAIPKMGGKFGPTLMHVGQAAGISASHPKHIIHPAIEIGRASCRERVCQYV